MIPKTTILDRSTPKLKINEVIIVKISTIINEHIYYYYYYKYI